jgi:hypothetical protein
MTGTVGVVFEGRHSISYFGKIAYGSQLSYLEVVDPRITICGVSVEIFSGHNFES